MKEYMKKIKDYEIEIYEGILFASLIFASFFIGYVGLDGVENGVYNLVEGLLNL